MPFVDVSSFEGLTFFNPTKLVFGKGAFEAVGKTLADMGLKKPLIILGKAHIKKIGLYDLIVKTLEEHGIEHVTIEGIRPNPEITNVRRGCALIREHKCDCVLPIGGGSVVDASKAMSLAYDMEDPWEFYAGRAAPTSNIPIICCLTLSATGTEMNGNSVVSNDEVKMKVGTYHQLYHPKVSFLDPLYQRSVSWYQTVNGGVDAMVHISEYMLKSQDEELDELTLGIDGSLCRTITKSLMALQTDPENYKHRANLCFGATLGLNGMSGVGLYGGCWITHWLQHTMGANFPYLSHGAGLGVIMPALMEHFLERGERVAAITRWSKELYGAADPADGIRRWRENLRTWGHPTTLHEYLGPENGADERREAVLNQLTDSFMKDHGKYVGNPLSRDRVFDVYSRCW
eukprot:gnl/Chilomastix_cuspidata/303.p2 GENE.gnl/Chilomastix_cuspidata/303~~gnl/Chilomastix_cuspidata/303.p2  ORF type:complete len:412 (-),score=207.36 gnl/Chilomastix_cuspidata/303:294-1499(-)